MKKYTKEELDRFDPEDIELAKRIVIEVSKDPNKRTLCIPPQRDDFDMCLWRVIRFAESALSEREGDQ